LKYDKTIYKALVLYSDILQFGVPITCYKPHQSL